MSAGMVPAGIEVVNPARGKTIDSTGVVIVQNAFMLVSTRPGPDKGALGIESWRFLEFADTTGPLTQVKFDTWAAEKQGVDGGSFDLHHHGGEKPMGELFIVLDGAAAFRYRLPGAPEQTTTIGAGGAIYFPPGVQHAGKCVGFVDARLLVIGVREASHPCDAGKKGLNIPSVG